MIKFIRYIPKVIHLLYIVSKYRVLTDSGNFELPFSLKVLGRFFSIILYPIGLFTKSNLNFGQRLAGLFQSLGPIYIKFGQTLSTRPDLIGTEVADSLKYLQDKLPPFSSKIVRARIEKRFGQKISDLFETFEDTPVAAASIAQVHKARLKSGEIVAVKILRPNIAQKYEEDIMLL